MLLCHFLNLISGPPYKRDWHSRTASSGAAAVGVPLVADAVEERHRQPVRPHRVPEPPHLPGTGAAPASWRAACWPPLSLPAPVNIDPTVRPQIRGILIVMLMSQLLSGVGTIAIKTMEQPQHIHPPRSCMV